METTNILGVNVSKHSINSAAEAIEKLIEAGGFNYVFTPNSEIILNAYKNPEFAEKLNGASFLIADGIGVVYASKILGNPIKERAAGFDTACRLMELMAQKGQSLYLFGAAPSMAEKAAGVLTEKYKGLKIAGLHDGYFDAEEEKNIIADINEKAPDVLFVCLGAPKQENWIVANKDKLNVKMAMGLGGCIDVFAGNVKRAPDIFIKLGLEWFYRLCKEPKRFFRMLALPKFMLTVIKVKLTGGHKK